ncbi:MAG: hypothetical protein LBT69_05290 [Lactobacillales bacterium]|jgi:hypothetical protein|nr:hypothetical protein [Lactobacillales bacterium]
MTQTASKYKSELDQFTLILKKLEQSLLSTKQKLKKEIEKNESLNQDILKLKKELPSYNNSKDKELKLALKQLEISQNQSLLFKEELDRTIEKLNEKIAENHQLDIINRSLQQKEADFSYPLSKDPSIKTNTVPMPIKLHTASDEKKIQELQEKLIQKDEENDNLQKQLSQADSHIFSKEEVTELFLQEKIFAKELENKEKEKRQEEECKASFNREEEQLYDELLSISKANQDFISRLSKLKDKKKKIKAIEEQKDD